MRNSSLLKWPNKNNKGNKNNNKEEKKWLHAPETLLAGHVVYLVKVIGDRNLWFMAQMDRSPPDICT